MGQIFQTAVLFGALIAVDARASSTAEPVAPLQCFEHLSQSDVSDEALIQAARLRLAELQSLQGKELRQVSHTTPPSDKIRLDTYGVPFFRLAEPKPGRVFRHFFGSRYAPGGEMLAGSDMREQITRSGRLVAGYTPYVKSDYPPRYYIEKFQDLTGVFLTLPNVDPEKIGVFEGPWVDVELAPEIPLLELEIDRIYLVPGVPNAVIPVRVLNK